jgi:hypothetical protein
MKEIKFFLFFLLISLVVDVEAQWNPFKSSCQEQSVIDKKHNMCSKLDITSDQKGNLIQTYGCATRNGEAFVDYYVKGNQLCYKSTFHY